MRLIETPKRTKGYYGRWRVLWLERLNQHQFTIQFNPFKLTRCKGAHISIDRRGRGSRWGYELINTARYPNYARAFPYQPGVSKGENFSLSFWFTNPNYHAWYAFHVYIYLPCVRPLAWLPNHRYAYSNR